MAILIHVLIAVSSILFAGYTLFSPSTAKVRSSYVLVALTLISGTYLVVVMPAHLVQSCVTGLVYLGVVGLEITSAQYRLHRSASDDSAAE